MSEKEIWEDWEGNNKIEKNTKTFEFNYNDIEKKTTDDFSKLLDEEGNNLFSIAFEEIYNKYSSKIPDDITFDINSKQVDKIDEIKVELWTTFDRLMKGEEIENVSNLETLERLFLENEKFIKIFENYIQENNKISEINKSILSVNNITNLIKKKIILEKGDLISNFKGNGFYFLYLNEDESYYIYNKKENKGIKLPDLEREFNNFRIKNISGEDVLITDTQVINLVDGKNILKILANNNFYVLNSFIYTNSSNDKLDDKKNNIIRFNKTIEINDKIILSNKGGNFIIFDKNTENIIYESKKGESIVEESLNPIIVTIIKPYGLKAELNIETGETIEDESKENKINKGLFGLGKLVIPTYFINTNDFDGFLRSPYLGKLLKLGEHGKNIFDIADKPAFKKILLETIEKNFNYFGTKIKFEKGVDGWSFFNGLEDYIEENYEKYRDIKELNLTSKGTDGLIIYKRNKYIKLLENKFIKLKNINNNQFEQEKIGNYFIGSENLTGEEYLIQLDNKNNIKHILMKNKLIDYIESKDGILIQEKIEN